jgi:integrase
MARKLTDRTIAKLGVPKGGPRVVFDTLATGFGIKALPSGKRVFVLQTKFPGHATQTTRTIGAYPAISLADARAKAVAWYGMARRGVDPAVEEAKAVAANARAAMLAEQRSFASVAESYITNGLNGQRQGKRVAHLIRAELLPVLGDRPIADITRHDITGLINAITRRRSSRGAYARNVLSVIRSVFNWAAEQDYGLESLPTDRIKATRLLGQRNVRTRVLTNAELARLWKATGELGYPYGMLIRVLTLTGARLHEIADATWQEVDFPNRVWRIPAARFKSNVEHHIPLAPDVLAILEALPRGSPSDYLFSYSGGTKPMNSFSAQKAKLDALMGETPPWTPHDLRRVVRSRLAELRTPDVVAELCLGHARAGIQKVYDRHTYETEIRSALESWERLLAAIVSPAPTTNVVELPRRA